MIGDFFTAAYLLGADGRWLLHAADSGSGGDKMCIRDSLWTGLFAFEQITGFLIPFRVSVLHISFVLYHAMIRKDTV